MKSRLTVLAAGLGAALVTGACGGSQPQQSNQAPATTSPAPADAAAQAAQSPQQTTQAVQQTGGKTVTAVDFEQLIALLPEASGWTRGKPKGEQVSVGVPMSHATVEYQKGESSIDLEITDSSFNQLVLSPFTMFLAAGFSERSNEGYTKSARIGGHPGFEKWNNASRQGEVTVVVGNRFIVAARGRAIDNIEPVKALVQAVNLSALAALK